MEHIRHTSAHIGHIDNWTKERLYKMARFDLDHTKKLPSGACAACAFLERVIEMQKNAEYRKQFEDKLSAARREHEAGQVNQLRLEV